MTRKEFIDMALSSASADCIVWPFAVRRSSGYGAYSLNSGKKRINIDAHRYVCARAHGAPKAGAVAAHDCDNRLCVNPHHLRWATPKENAEDAQRRGRLVGGGRGRERLTPDDVRHIRRSKKSLVKLGVQYGLCPSHIGKVRRGEVWGKV